jgi:putative ABC transport system permease protein
MDKDKDDHNRFLNRSLKWLSWFCPPQLLEGIEGDLAEQYKGDVDRLGRAKARRRLFFTTARFLHHEIILRNKIALRLINTIMLGNYIRVAARNIQKRKLYSMINAIGLSIGIAFCMLIWLFVRDERSFDQFHENKADIVRLEENSYNYWNADAPESEKWNRSAYIQTGLLPEIKRELPEIALGTRLNHGTGVVKNGDRVFKEDVSFVDGDFFRMFSFPLIQGNRDRLFSNTLEVVVTPEISTKYFDNGDPMGKMLVIDDKEFVVAGVIEAPPANSSIDYKILLPQENKRNYERQLTRWGNFNTPTFVQLKPGTNRASFVANVDRVMDKHMEPMIVDWRKEGNLPADQKMFEYVATQLVDVHMDKAVGWHKASDPQYSYILGGIALLILIIACINYVSLALTTSAARRTEVGIRKVVGALKNQLLYQFAFESIVLAVLSAALGVALVLLFLPFFNDFTGKGISINWETGLQLGGISALLGFIVGALSGVYPALYLAKFRPALVLKGGFTTRLQAGFTRPLVVLQFALSAFLIISSTIMFKQMRYVATRDLGFNEEAVLVVPMPAVKPEDRQKMVQQFRARLEREDNIQSMGGVDLPFNRGWSRNGFKIDGVNRTAYVYSVDPYYIPTLDIQLAAGRNFDVNIASDSDAVIVNEALVRDMKWDDPIGQYYNWKEDTVGMGDKVIGVVKDYNYRSLEAPIDPMLMSMDWPVSNALIRIGGGDMPATLDRISAAWKELFPDMPYNYSFIEDDLADQYKSYDRWIRVMGFATGFAIVISCLGLFGLAGINAVNRTREIGIRKVMGAGLSNIFVLLNRQYVVLSMIAFALAIPASYYVMKKWLSGFEFRITMGWDIFILSMAIGLAVAVLTVSYHGLKAAFINPAETLKYE